MLIPIEGQEDCDAILTFFKKNPFREPCVITVLHVMAMVDPVWPVGAMIPPEFRKEMKNYAEKFTQVLCLELEKLGIKLKVWPLKERHHLRLLMRSPKTKPDLLVLRPQSHSAAGPFFPWECFPFGCS